MLKLAATFLFQILKKVVICNLRNKDTGKLSFILENREFFRYILHAKESVQRPLSFPAANNDRAWEIIMVKLSPTHIFLLLFLAIKINQFSEKKS